MQMVLVMLLEMVVPLIPAQLHRTATKHMEGALKDGGMKPHFDIVWYFGQVILPEHVCQVMVS